MKSWVSYLVVPVVIVLCSFWIVAAQPDQLPQVSLDTSSTGPRQVEDTTEKALERDYARAWDSMATALNQNRVDLLETDFVGVALDSLKDRITQQQSSNLHTRMVDHGHKLQAVFYSPEGSAVQLRDTAQFEVQYLDGDRVVSSQQLTQNYTVIMTAGENRWKVRVLQPELGQE